MQYKAIVETDDYKDFEFFEDGIGKYMVGIDVNAAASGGWMPLYFTECNQEPILEKVIAEIEELPTTRYTETCKIYTKIDDFKENVLAILNKYKEESEEA